MEVEVGGVDGVVDRGVGGAGGGGPCPGGGNRSADCRVDLPAEWLPPLADAYCTYATDWTATELRWRLTADKAETAALRELAEGCGHQQVTFTPAPRHTTDA
ncbi:hypothetical protein [Streptomyces sp. NBC_01304]|uniref:hypothetical protein n=1 Tax=Streptomyces sp. NBC_01304 TaxID=2903818 RepID=UPI002E0F9AC3